MGFFQSNGIYKLASVIIAIALTIYVYGEQNPVQRKTFTLPLEVINKPNDVLIRSMPESVRVEIAGSREALLQLRPADLRAIVNLAGRDPGRYQLKVVVRPRAGIVLPVDLSKQPVEAVVAVELEPVVMASRRLEPVFTRPAPAGYSYGIPVTQPETAVLSGPRDAIRRVVMLQVVVDASVSPGASVNAIFPIRALASDGSVVDNVSVRPEEARVRVELQRSPAEKEVYVSPNVVGSPSSGYRVASIETVPAAVVLTGTPEVLGKLGIVTTEQISVEGATENVVRSVQVALPQGVTVQGSKRVRVEITIQPRPTSD